ncbi:MAG: Ig-like domain repeat protein [Acidobacteriota bacterium]
MFKTLPSFRLIITGVAVLVISTFAFAAVTVSGAGAVESVKQYFGFHVAASPAVKPTAAAMSLRSTKIRSGGTNVAELKTFSEEEVGSQPYSPSNIYAPTIFSDPAYTAIDNTTGAITAGTSVGSVSLRSALQAANTLGGTHTVNLPAGTYNLTRGSITMNDIAENITISGAGAATTIINMTATLQNRIMLVGTTGTQPNMIMSISGVQFTNGVLTGDIYGGGAIIAGGPGNSLTLTNCIFQNNSISPTATNTGGPNAGGAVRYNGGGTLIIDNCQFINNSSPNGEGGAVSYFLENLVSAGNGSLSITNSSFTGNSVGGVGGASGGALSVAAQGIITPGVTLAVSVSKNTFTNNSAIGATNGGGAISVTNSFDIGNTWHFNYNRIVNNTVAMGPTGIFQSGGSQGSVDAKDNWWGCDTGPTAAGTCDKAAKYDNTGGAQDVSTWLQLRTTASPSTIVTNQTSSLSTSFLTNSAGTAVSISNLSRLIGLPVTWSSLGGNLSAQQTTIQAAGTATSTYSETTGVAGTHSGTAVVDNLPSSGSLNTAAITVTKANTTTVITSSLNTATVTGQPYTVAYSVTGAFGNSPTAPTGNVQVSDGTNTCTGTVAAGSCSLASFTAGAKTITATYQSDANFNASPASSGVSHLVIKANTTVAVTDPNNPSVFGQSVTFTATITVSAPGAGSPTGNVTFQDNGVSIGTCTAQNVLSNAATCTLNNLSVATHPITAVYNSDANFNASPASPILSQVVNKANTTTSITSDNPDPSVTGQSVTVAYSVSVASPGAGTPIGNVVVTDNGNPFCTDTIANGSCSSGLTTAGVHSFVATYQGDSNFNASPGSSPASHTVNKANTTTAISSDTPDPSVINTAYTVTASVSVTSPGSGTPTGTITVSDGTDSCTITLPAVSCMLTSTTKGSKTLTATYGSDANFNGSSGSASHAVFAPPTVSKFFVNGAQGNTNNTNLNGTARLSIAITNPPGNAGSLSGIAITDPFPAGLEVDASPSPTNTCGGSLTGTATGSTSFGLTGGALASPGNQCVISVQVKATTAGAITNTTGNVSSTEGGTGGTASGTLNVFAPPTVTKQFSPANVNPGDPSQMTITITNPASNPGVLTGLAFTDTFPTGMTVASTPGLSSTCGTVTGATSGSGSIALAAGSSASPGSSCTVQVNVTATQNGTNTVSVDSTRGGVSAPASDTLFTCLSNPIVTLITDTNISGDLRYALANVCAAPNNNVTFNLGVGPHTITTASMMVVGKDVTITNTLSGTNGPVTVNGNGGAFRIFQVNSPVTSAIFRGFTISGGNESTLGGGGLLVQSGTVTLNSMLLTGNSATGTIGGGAQVKDGASLNVYNSTISGNNAKVAGGISNQSSTLNLLNSTVTNNTAVDFSGGIHNQQVLVGDPVPVANIKNSIVSGNVAPINVDITPGSYTDQGNNLIGISAGLIGLANNGGLTSTHALSPASAAINAGDNAAATGAGLSSDQRGTGFARIADTTVDIGAFEAHYAVSATAGNNQTTLVGTAFGTQLKVTVTEAGNPVSGISVTFTAPASGSSGVFQSSGTNTETVVTNASGVATASVLTANTSVGSYTANASIGAGQPTVTFNLKNVANTSTAVTSNHNPSVHGQGVTFTATVSSVGSAIGTLTGSVTFLDGGLPFSASCTGVSLSGGQAQCTTSTLGIGNHTITAAYSGDTNFNSSNGSLNGNPQVVNQAASTTAIVSNQNPSVYGQSVTITTTVAASGPGVGTPTGTISFLDGGNPISALCTGVSLSGGTASCTTTALGVGNHTITANYSGDTNFSSSNGSMTGNPQVVNKADTTTTIVSDNPDSSAVGQSVTVVFTVVASSPGAGTPAGNVMVSDGVNSCSATVAAGSCMVALTTPGARTLTATYAGDTNFNGGSGTEPHTVVAPPAISKAFTPASVSVGGTSQLKFTITNPAANTVALTGVGFTDSFPAGLVVGTPNGLALGGSCGAPSVTATAGTTSVVASNITIGVGQSCTVTVNATATAAGPLINTTAAVTSTNGGTGNTATATLQTSLPVLAVTKTHVGTLTQGQVGAWTIQVTNNGLTGADVTSGTTTVSDVLPAGYTLASYTGTNWTCTGTATVTCTSTQAIAGAGGTFPLITLNVNVPAASPVSVSNTAKAFGGGDQVHTSLASAASGTDNVTVAQTPAGITIVGGNNQSAVIQMEFAQPLSVLVKDAGNVPVAGASVTFTAPSFGPSGFFFGRQPAMTANTNASGIATTTALTANGVAGGPYGLPASTGSVSTSFSLTNLVGPVTHFAVTAPVSALPGVAFNFTVMALDAGENIVVGYSGTVHFTSTDGAAVLPANTTLIAGTRTLSATLATAGIQRITATDTVSAISGVSNNINVIGTGRRTRADFDGDGRSDISVFRPSEGNWYLFNSSIGFSAVHWGQTGDVIVPGDYDGDGKADFAVWRPSVAVYYVLNSSNFTFTSISYGQSTDIPVTGDFDGDGRADFAVYRPSTSTWFVNSSSTAQTASILFGAAGDIPFSMDNDGDGKSNIAVYRPSNGTWYIARPTGVPATNFDAIPFGTTGDIIVPADYDGDGRDDIAVFRPSSGTWFIVRSSDGGLMQTHFGSSSDIPVPADYDGDGRDDIAVYRPSNGTWYLNGSTDGFAAQVFGISTDIPVPAAYHP